MIRFVMVKPKEELSTDYVKGIFSSLSKISFVKSCNIYEENDREWKTKIVLKDDTRYFTEMMLGTYNGIQHLFIHIEPQRIHTNEFDLNLHELKLLIKQQLRRDWEECVWLEDEQSTSISEQLYGRIYRVENVLRQFINIVMIRKFGVKWWENYSPFHLQEKYKVRQKDYKMAADSFKNVSDRLLSIDTDDLLTIMTYQVKKLSISDTSTVEVMLERVKEKGEVVGLVSEYKAIINEMKNNMEIKVDLWEEIFKEYFPEKFIDEWKRFCKNRNHVAHNKLLDHGAFNKISENISNIEGYLNKARDEFDKELSEEEESEILEYVEEEERRKELHELYIMEEEAGISILDAKTIFDKFDEVINSFIENIDDTYYFRNDIEIEKNMLSFEKTEQELLIITSKINDNKLEIKSKLHIEDGPEGESEALLELFVNQQETEKCGLTYKNGGAEFQKDLGYYLPTVYNKFSQEEFEEFVSEVSKVIEENFPDLKDKIDGERYNAAKQGGSDPVADFSCEECGEEYVCIDEDICKKGICVNCGCEHEVSKCDRCEVTYNSGLEGNEQFCDNCLEYFKGE